MARAHGLLARAARMRSEHPSERADDLVAITDTNLDAPTRAIPSLPLGRVGVSDRVSPSVSAFGVAKVLA